MTSARDVDVVLTLLESIVPELSITTQKYQRLQIEHAYHYAGFDLNGLRVLVQILPVPRFSGHRQDIQRPEFGQHASQLAFGSA